MFYTILIQLRFKPIMKRKRLTAKLTFALITCEFDTNDINLFICVY